MPIKTDFLIIGAGPFGLAMSAYAGHLAIDHLVVGRPMEFWRRNMPDGMLLRSKCDWHLDPIEVDTIESYLRVNGLTPADVEPLTLERYLDYAAWFQQRKGIDPLAKRVERLDHSAGRFHATLEDGALIEARNVLLAIGFQYFRNQPVELTGLLPPGCFSHSCDLVDFSALETKRILLIGGRQSAFESAALLREQGVAEVHISHRHETPAFMESEWGWIHTKVGRFVGDPSWYRRLSGQEKTEINRLFAEARVKFEPWLWPRIDHDNVRLWPESQLSACRETDTGELEVRLDTGVTLTVDHVILATGYQPDMKQVPFLAAGNLYKKLRTEDGYPLLDERFQSSIPGLYVTSMAATRAFGAFFAFTVGVRASAHVIGDAIASP